MRIIDLSQPLFDKMPVYPGDPEVKIEKFLTLEKDGWNMNTISLPAHIATHINVPIHAVENGKTLDDFSLEAFFGPAVLFPNDIKPNVGLLFESAAITQKIVQKIIQIKPKFVGIGGYFESEEELATEKLLLKNDIISYEGLINLDQLPKDKEFMFYGFPLNIRSGDGSPVRAVVFIK